MSLNPARQTLQMPFLRSTQRIVRPPLLAQFPPTRGQHFCTPTLLLPTILPHTLLPPTRITTTLRTITTYYPQCPPGAPVEPPFKQMPAAHTVPTRGSSSATENTRPQQLDAAYFTRQDENGTALCFKNLLQLENELGAPVEPPAAHTVSTRGSSSATENTRPEQLDAAYPEQLDVAYFTQQEERLLEEQKALKTRTALCIENLLQLAHDKTDNTEKLQAARAALAVYYNFNTLT